VYEESLPGVRWGMQRETVWCPPTDVYETDESAVVIVEIPGLAVGDYEISLHGRTLTITGERRDPAEKLGYQQMEIRYGKFRTEINLPWPLDNAGQLATYENGFLKVVLRKARIRRIPVHAIPDSDG
jgi:HSP20 family protein